MRIEDVDRAREQPGAADSILHTLERYGLHWDGPVLRQSTRGDAYAAALESLRARGLVYACSCTRGELGGAGDGPETRYTGTCRAGPRHPERATAQRLSTRDTSPVTAVDRVRGALSQDVEATVGDFVLRRRDGYWAYQLAVVVDDAAQRVTDVVRGLDLWDNTPRQMLLQRALGVPTPGYLHLPLVVEPDGRKLSKSLGALPIAGRSASHALGAALAALQHPLPTELAAAPVAEQLAWARMAWNPARFARIQSVPGG